MPGHASLQPKRKQLIYKSVALILITTTLLALLLNLQQVAELLSRATAEKANIIVDAEAITEPLPRPWRNLAQGGESQDWRLAPVADYVRPLNPEYIRIDHVFDFYDVVSGTSGNLSFDFSQLDLLIDDILLVGAKPYISLSYMPSAISSGDVVAAPTNYGDWQLTVQRTIEHLSGTRGIPDVYYEVWNEPDLFGDWKVHGSKNYLTLYTAAAQGAQAARVTQPFKIGGPATTGLYRNWIDGLARHAIDNNLRLDFLSWHRYSTTIDDFRDDMWNVQNWLQSYPQLPNLELHISEWGHDSENHAGYDTMYGAAHTAAAAMEMTGVVERAFVFEIQDGKDPAGKQLWGRWGLMTHSDTGLRLKPRYRALEMLEKLQPMRLSLQGKGTYVKALASREIEGTISVMFANFDKLGRNYEQVPVTIYNLDPGQYQVVTTSLLKPPLTQTIAIESNTLTTTLMLQPYEVALMEITAVSP